MTPDEIQDAIDLAVDCCDGAECSDDDVDRLCGYVLRMTNEIKRLQTLLPHSHVRSVRGEGGVGNGRASDDMVDRATKRRVAQLHVDAIAKDSGPVYGVRLIDSLPIGDSAMQQAMPSRADLEQVRAVNDRVAAGYEVLLAHWRHLSAEVQRLNCANESA